MNTKNHNRTVERNATVLPRTVLPQTEFFGRPLAVTAISAVKKVDNISEVTTANAPLLKKISQITFKRVIKNIKNLTSSKKHLAFSSVSVVIILSLLISLAPFDKKVEDRKSVV